MKQLASGAILFWVLISPSYGQEDRSWHLLTRTEGGTISLIKDLTEHECEFVRARALGEPATEDEKAAARRREERRQEDARKWAEGHPEEVRRGILSVWGGGTKMVSPGDIKSAECFK